MPSRIKKSFWGQGEKGPRRVRVGGQGRGEGMTVHAHSWARPTTSGHVGLQWQLVSLLVTGTGTSPL